MAKEIYKCSAKKPDCFAYDPDPKMCGKCHALSRPAKRKGGACAFYKPRTAELNLDTIRADCEAYAGRLLSGGKEK